MKRFNPFIRTSVVNDSINAGKVIRLANEIKSWQMFLQSKGIVKIPSRIVGDKNAAFPIATFQGLSVDLEDNSRSRGRKYRSNDENDRPEFPCGKYHNIPYCNYLNPKRSRPQWWKPNNNLDFARKVKLEIEELEEKRTSNNFISKYSAMSNEQQNRPEWDNFGAASLAGSASPCSLYDSVILDSGTNVQIINAATSHRIISSREFTSIDRVHFGDDVPQAVSLFI
ncbi:hypothetical protein Golomagni_06584 [Golovinomyces magnicellulatus]|nr:hypothetical protein Golomagni_06584 [Golovinomyces magnicellulatus]